MIVEAEKSHNLLSSSWKPKKPMKKFSLSLKASDPGGVKGLNPSPKAKED